MDRAAVESTIERIVARATGAMKATFPEGEDVLDPNELASSMEIVKSRLEELFTSRRASRLLRLAGGILKRIVTSKGFREYALHNRDANIREGDERIAALHLGPELLDLLLAADSLVRNGGMIAFFDLYPVDLREPPNLAPLSGLAHIEKLTGERRAVEVLRAFIPVCEFLYVRVARGVRKLEMFADGETMAPGLSLGNVLAAARARNGHAARILDLDAAWIRNAAAHSRYSYIPADHALELWNKSGPRRRFPVAVLEERLNSIAEFAMTTAYDVMGHYQQKYVISRGDLDEAFLDVLPALLGGDPQDREERGERFIAVLQREFEPLIHTLEAPQPRAALPGHAQ